MDATGWDARYAKGQVWSSEPNRFFAEIVDGLDRYKAAKDKPQF